MALPKLAISAFMLAALLFAIVAFLPMMRGEGFNVTYFALAVVFFVLGVGTRQRRDRDSSRPST